MSPERSVVQWGTTKIPYTVQRSTRRGTVSVAVEPSGSVVLTAPASTPIPRLDRVVRAKARWIVDRVRRRSDLPPAAEREFVSGETVLYLGRSYRLRVREHGKVSIARLDRGHLVVTVPRGGRPEIKEAIVAWYRRHAEARLRERVALWAARLRVEVPEVRLTEPRQRWGSCTPSGVLRLNWRIVQAPMSLVDYVVAHELVHLVHAHHGETFWSALGRVMPEYEERRRALVERGAGYVW